MKSRMVIFTLLLIAVMAVPVSAQTLSWDPYTLTLHHFDSTNTIQSYNQTHGVIPFNQYGFTSSNYRNKNFTMDQTGLFWKGTGHPGLLSTNAKFGNYSHAQIIYFTDLIDQYEHGFSDWQSTPYNSDWDFGTSSTKNWTAEGWIYVAALPRGGNNTVIDWQGNGTACGGASCPSVDSYKYNGTAIGIDKYGFITAWYSPKDKIGNSTAAIPVGSWRHFAVVNNGTSLYIFNNGILNGTFTVGTTYNFTAGYDASSGGSRPVYVGAYETPYLLLDEIRVSNITRYNGWFLPQQVPFFTQNNASTLVSQVLAPRSNKFAGVSTLPLDSNTYAYGDVVPYTVEVRNLSYTTGMFLPLVNLRHTFGDAGTLDPSLNSSMVSRGWVYVTDPTKLPVSSTSFSHINELPLEEENFYTQTYYSIDDVNGEDGHSMNRLYTYIDTNASQNVGTTGVGLYDILSPAGDTGYTQAGFPTDLTNQYTSLYTDAYPLSKVPGYSTSFTNERGGVSTLKNMKNLTPDVSFVDYTDYYGSSYIGYPGMPGGTVNVGEIFNVTVYEENVFLTYETDYSIAYNSSTFKYRGVIKNNDQIGLSQNTTLTSTYYDTGDVSNSVNITISTADYPPFMDKINLISAGEEQTYPIYNMSTVQLEVISADYPDFGPLYGVYIYGYDGKLYPHYYYTEGYMSSGNIFSGYGLSGNILNAYEITDDPLETTYELININTGQPIKGGATVVYDNRNASPASPQNVVGGVFTLTHKGGTSNMTVAADGFFTTTQTFTIGTTGTTQKVYLTPLSGASPNLNMLYPHECRIIVVDLKGAPIATLPTTMVMLNSTTYGTNWFNTLFGVPPSATDIEGTTMYGYTDSFGSIVFPVVGSGYYMITFTDPTRGISTSYYLHPDQATYTLSVPTTASQSAPSQSDYIFTNLSVFESAPNVYLNMTYRDIGNMTTHVNYTVRFPNNTVYYTNYFNGSSALVANTSYPVANVRGNQYVWGYTAYNTQFGWLNRSQGITLKGVDGILFNPFVYKDRW